MESRLAVNRATRTIDEQGESFDRRAGLPSSVPDLIAREFLLLAPAGAGDVVLEVGAGTGQIGAALCQHPLRYVGFDASAAMLETFRHRCGGNRRRVSLIEADGNNSWPVCDGTVKAVFCSRAVHLLHVEHVVEEVFRVVSPTGAVFVLGRLQRERQSLRARIRREMRHRLRQFGYRSDEGRQREREIMDACVRRGAAPLERRVAATWPVRYCAAQVLASWREKRGLAGLDVPGDVKETVLAQLATWAKYAFGSLEALQFAEEKYVLEGVRLPLKP